MKNPFVVTIYFFVGCLALWSCGSTPKTEEKLTGEVRSSTQCYGSYTDKDSVFVRLTFTGDIVKGNLTYKLFEKDRNIGVIEGTMHGDTLIAAYKFSSEGKSSEREVAFLKQGDTLVEGFAPMDDSGTRFQNKHDVDFAGIVLQADTCRD